MSCCFVVGFVYGAKENKKMQLFIDDLNLPVPDKFGVQRGNEVSIIIFIFLTILSLEFRGEMR